MTVDVYSSYGGLRSAYCTVPVEYKDTPIQWVTGFELLFGCPITALAQYEGSRIGSTRWTCDKYGHRLTAT